MRELKDVGVAWLGSIPEKWNTQKARWLFKERNEKGNPVTVQLLTPSQKYGVLPQDVYQEVSGTKPVQVDADKDLSEFKTVRRGDFCISLSAYMGGFEYSEYEGVISPAYHSFYHVSNETNNSYYKHLFKSSAFIDAINCITPQSVRVGRNTSFDSFKDVLLPVPPVDEQSCIADYLDTKCSFIDSIITKQEQVIEKLKEYKLAIITEVVTKGLNPNAEMKDSGIDYIGAIPKTWGICRLRNIGKLQNGISKGGESFGFGTPFVSYGDVYKHYSLPEKVTGVDDASEDEKEHYSVQEGDIFFTRTSETIEEVGFSCVCEKTIPEATFAGFLIRVRPFDRKLLTSFSKYYFRASHHRRYLVKEMNLVTRASLGQDLLKGMVVLVPPASEQGDIVSFLDKRCVAIDSAIKAKESLIEKWTRYKKSVIYEVVTGKKEV